MSRFHFFRYSGLLAIFVCIVTFVNAQEQARLLMEPNNDTAQFCYDVALEYKGNRHIMVASQNYRFFYSSASLEFDPETSGSILPEETYTYRLVQHQNHVDGSSIGRYPFDNDLGFINISVILNNTNSLGAGIDRHAPELSLVRLCFNETEEVDKYIIPARESKTKEYGRAYIDVSYVGEDGKINSLDFSSFKDIHLPKN